MVYTLMVARADSQPIRVLYALMAPLREPLERWRLTRVDLSEPAYNGIYPDGHPSRSTAYRGPLHRDGTLRGATW